MRQQQKIIYVACVVLFACILLLYITSTPSQADIAMARGAAPQQAVTVMMADAPNDRALQALSEFLPEITGQLVELTLQPADSYDQTLALMLSSDSAPDIFEVGEQWAGTYVQQGWLADLAGSLPKDLFAQLQSGTLAQAQSFSDEGVYAVPAGIQTVRLVYNNAIFKGLSLDVPDSFDDLVACAKRIEQAYGSSGISGFMLCADDGYTGHLRLMESALAAGGEVIYDPTSDFVNLLPYTKWTDAIAAMQQDGSLYPTSQSLSLKRGAQAFANGKAGMLLTTSQGIAELLYTKDYQAFTITSAPTPTGKTLAPGELLRTGYFALNANSADDEGAIAVFNALYDEESLAYMEESGKLLTVNAYIQQALPTLALPTRNESTRTPAPAHLAIWTRAQGADALFDPKTQKYSFIELAQNINARRK